MSPTVLVRASPSLALVKYWGKRDARRNLPATPSLAVTLGGVHTQTRVTLAEEDRVTLDGQEQDRERFAPFFDALRRRLHSAARFRVDSRNDFPTAAGLASSSSGFAALAVGCARVAGRELPGHELSALARLGSASAARAVYGGFTLLPAGARYARQLYGEEHWPELRIVIAVVSTEAKPLASRRAMQATRSGSPYYRAWLAASGRLLPRALEALERRDLEMLGQAARLSYSRMHAALLAAEPPALYWLPATVAVIRECAGLRARGIGAWETIDAGPQVKILCLEGDAPAVLRSLREIDPRMETILCRPGPGPTAEALEE
jgi:diphosphomevalonate decarboxylase